MDQIEIRNWVRRAMAVLDFKTYAPLAKIMGIDANKLSKAIGKGAERGKPRAIGADAILRLVNHLKSVGLYDSCPLPGDEEHSSGNGHAMDIRRIEETEERGYNKEKYEPRTIGAIPEIDVTIGAGEGTVGDFVQIKLDKGGESAVGHKVIAEWKFPDGYLQNTMKVSARNSIVMEVRGDSMDPTIRHGDKIVVDLGITTFGDDGLYLISDGHSAPRLKRLEYIWKSDPPTVKVISDNPSHREAQVMSLLEMHIVGRVAARVSAM
jgi:hypothetical protein